MTKVGDEDAYVVVMKSEDGNPVTAYFSTKTFLLLRRDTLASSGPVTVLTAPSLVAVLAAGWISSLPLLHSSAELSLQPAVM